MSCGQKTGFLVHLAPDLCPKVINFPAMKRLLGRLALDLLGSCALGALLMLIFPVAVGVVAGLVVFALVSRPSIMAYREEVRS